MGLFDGGQTGDASLAAQLTLPEFPRSAGYPPEWMLENLMGPNAVWLAESLSQVLPLEPGMRVLDMGCGKGISSIFLAKEFGVQVWATDLWIKPTENWGRIRAAGLEDCVFPIYAEAHALPFADGFFDAAISLDAYHYFGTADLYLSYYARFVRPGGRLGIVVPGIVQEFVADVPAHLTPYWEPDFWSFHSPDWWRTHWERAQQVDVTHADMVPDGWRHWLTWLEVATAHGYPSSKEEAAMVRLDAGRHLGFARLVACKR
jgi:cyclopropane fatty-acyl-phospholipid synthase-like methyltransferase